MVRLIRAPNPSPMTLTGTNSYIVAAGRDAVVIDPGPSIDAHLEQLATTAREAGLKIAAIALTHGHPDHSQGARTLARAVDAPIYAHPSGYAGRDADLPIEGTFRAGAVALHTIDAPGHTFDHVAFYLEPEGALFTGDVILGEGTTVVAPPGGAMRPYVQTLHRLANEFGNARTIYGGHGEIVTQPRAKIEEYIAHRAMREDQILTALRDGPKTIPELVVHIYGAHRQVLWPAMARQVLAHLIALEEDGRVSGRKLHRELTADESAMLNPRIELLVGPEEAAVLIAELGTELHLESLYEYRLL